MLLIFPKGNTATRFYRPGEKSNTILLTERCDQYCTMCSQPPKSNDFTHWELYSQACCQMPDNQTVGISGGEPTLYKKDLFKFNEIFVVRFFKIIFSSLMMGIFFNYLMKIFENQLIYSSSLKSIYLILSVLLGLMFYLMLSFFIKAFNYQDVKLKY